MKKINFDFDFQQFSQNWSKDFNEFWSGEQVKKFQKHLSIAKLKSLKFSKTVYHHDWKSEATKFENIYYVNKAFFYGASQDLPFKTLYLLGTLLSEKNVHEEVKYIVQNNVLKYKGIFLKLDDLDNQKQIRKILRTYQFEKINHLKAA